MSFVHASTRCEHDASRTHEDDTPSGRAAAHTHEGKCLGGRAAATLNLRRGDATRFGTYRVVEVRPIRQLLAQGGAERGRLRVPLLLADHAPLQRPRTLHSIAKGHKLELRPPLPQGGEITIVACEKEPLECLLRVRRTSRAEGGLIGQLKSHEVLTAAEEGRQPPQRHLYNLLRDGRVNVVVHSVLARLVFVRCELGVRLQRPLRHSLAQVEHEADIHLGGPIEVRRYLLGLVAIERSVRSDKLGKGHLVADDVDAERAQPLLPAARQPLRPRAHLLERGRLHFDG